MMIKRLIVCVGVLVVVLFGIFAAHITATALDEIPKGVLVYGGNVIPFIDYASKQQKTSNITAFSVTGTVVASDTGAAADVSAIYTDDKHAAVMNKQLVTGTWFGISAMGRENNNVVIGTDLAARLFFSTEVIERELIINGRVYRICGVCESGSGFVRDISSDGRSVIYLPYTAAATPSAQYLFISGTGDIRVNDVRYMVFDSLGIDISGLPVSAVGDKVELLRVYPLVFLRFVIVFSLLLLALLIARLLTDAFYNREKRSRKEILVILSAVLTFAVLIYLLCIMPKIPESFRRTRTSLRYATTLRVTFQKCRRQTRIQTTSQTDI